MHNFVHEMLHDSHAAQRMEALWHVRHTSGYASPRSSYVQLTTRQEYEEQSSDEARFVKGRPPAACVSVHILI